MSDEGRWGLHDVMAMLRRACRAVIRNRDRLSELDAACGDGDHGVSMARGFGAVAEKLAEAHFENIAALLRSTGSTLISSTGGAIGPLMGTFFLESAKALETRGETGLDTAALAIMFRAGLEGICRRGGAEAGEKTMVDALLPAVEALDGAELDGAAPPDALRRAAEAARAGAVGTAAMISRQGKSRYLGARAVGCEDPGANSIAIIIEAFADAEPNGDD